MTHICVAATDQRWMNGEGDRYALSNSEVTLSEDRFVEVLEQSIQLVNKTGRSCRSEG